MIDPLDFLRGDVKEDFSKEKIYSGILLYGASQKLYENAQRLADTLGVKIERIGADLQDAIKTKNPEIILFEDSDESLALASRLSQRLKIGLVSGCVKFEIDHSRRALLSHRQIYGGRMMEVVVCNTKPQMAVVKC